MANWKVARILFGGEYFLNASVTTEATPPVSVDDIHEAIAQRNAHVQSGRFAWTACRWLQKGAIWPGTGADWQKTPNPKQDSEFVADRLLVFSDGNVRYESFGPEWHHVTDSYVPHRLTTTWNGVKSYVFLDPESAWRGYIYDRPWFSHLGTFAPLAMTYRPLDRNWRQIDVREFTVNDERERISGVDCVVLEKTTLSPPIELGPRLEQHLAQC